MQHATARQQLRLLGGVVGDVDKNGSFVSGVTVLIQRNVEVMTENGLRTEKRTIASFLVKEVGTLARGNKLIVGDKAFDIHELLDDDGYVVRVFLRG
jgi:hypothetical protein